MWKCSCKQRSLFEFHKLTLSEIFSIFLLTWSSSTHFSEKEIGRERGGKKNFARSALPQHLSDFQNYHKKKIQTSKCKTSDQYYFLVIIEVFILL